MKELLEQIFDIPFEETSGYYPERWVKIAPAGSNKDLFDIVLSIKNKVRIVVTFNPQRYSVKLIRNMGLASDEKRELFISNIKTLVNLGVKTDIKINGLPHTFLDGEQWPESWETFDFRLSKFVSEAGLAEPGVCDNEMEHIGGLVMGTFLSLVNIVPIEGTSDGSYGYTEGEKKQVLTTKYERNPLNRFLCIQQKGTCCAVCGINMSQIYGPIGNNFIHIHHVTPVSQLGPGYVVNPMTDLIPVCPNCHAMLHRRNPPYAPEELRKIMSSFAG